MAVDDDASGLVLRPNFWPNERMTTPATSVERGERFVGICILLLRRAVGLGLFVLGVAYWVRIVGVFPGENWRFDLMSPPWRVAASILAVLCPIAGVGLWLAASWGIAVWIILVALELAMHFGLPHIFGEADWEPISLVTGLVLLIALRIAVWELRRRGVPHRASGE